eukprot:Skav220591  [mRNA]  locus=scaffold2744:34028:34570:+ [translate_table: standard]
MICRLAARSVYLASELPLTVLEVANPIEAPPLAIVVQEMDVLDELSAVSVKEFRSYWSEIREVYLAPPKPVMAAALDPAVAGGMAKGFANSGWQQADSGRPARRRKAKKITTVDEDPGDGGNHDPMLRTLAKNSHISQIPCHVIVFL